MTRSLGRAVLAAVGAMAWTAGAILAGALAASPAPAQSCLPSPTLLFGEVARVGGTNTQLWADVQQVENDDAAQATSGSGQVIQDMLSAVNRDGYDWDCALSQLAPSAAAGAADERANAARVVAANTGAADNSTGDSSGVAAAQSPPTTGSSGTHVPILPLVALVLVSLALLAGVVRWQMSRH